MLVYHLRGCGAGNCIKLEGEEAMSVTVALAGDTMLGRSVGQRMVNEPFESFVDQQLREVTAAADLFVLNLECCVSDRGERWRAAGKPYFFRAPPRAAEFLSWLGVDCVTLANNHALDYGPLAMRDTRMHLGNAGILTVGAGVDVESARTARVIPVGEFMVGILGVTDHPADFAAGEDWAGVAYADLHRGFPRWLSNRVRSVADTVDVTIVTPHWGPNMTREPGDHIRTAARLLLEAGADLVAGHSAHVPHGVWPPILYDMGDFIDDYAVDPRLRNDLGLLFLVTLDTDGVMSLQVIPLKLEFCRTTLAAGADAAWLHRHFADACGRFGVAVDVRSDGRMDVAMS
jgi:poly-gamma-glutamate capsule biosynthesis protein CapA/YwtB (metallophosphatase superfamily)